MAAQRLIRGLAVAAGVAVVVAGLVFAPRLLRGADFLRVRRLQVDGWHYLAPSEVVRALRLADSASLLDPVEPLLARVRAVPGVASAEIRRHLPGTLQVVVTEVEPVGLVAGPEGMRFMSAAGTLLPYDAAATAPDLPVLAAPDSQVAGLLGRVRSADPRLAARVAAAWRQGDHVVLEDEAGRWIRLRPNASPEAIRSVTLVAQDLSRRGRPYSELDGRFAEQVVVRGRPG